MHLDIDREELLKAARQGQRFCGNPRTNPIHAHLLIRVQEDLLEVAATDISRSLRFRLQPDKATVHAPGVALVPADRLVGILGPSSEPRVELKSTEGTFDGRVEVTMGKGRFEIFAENPADFPELPTFPERVDVVVRPARSLIDIGHKCKVATTSDEQRFSFDSVCMIVEDGQIQGVSTDGRRLVSVTTDADIKSGFTGRKLIVPEMLMAFGRLGPQDDPVEIAFGERHICMRNGLAEVAVVDREGKFPPIEKVFRKDPAFSLGCERSLLLQALQQVSFLLDNEENSIHVKLAGEALVIHGQSSRGGQGQAEVPVENAGEGDLPPEASDGSFEVEFDPDLLIDFLKVMEDEQIEIGFRTPNEQVKLRETAAGVDYIVMPIRKEEEAPEPAGAGAA